MWNVKEIDESKNVISSLSSRKMELSLTELGKIGEDSRRATARVPQLGPARWDLPECGAGRDKAKMAAAECTRVRGRM